MGKKYRKGCALVLAAVMGTTILPQPWESLGMVSYVNAQEKGIEAASESDFEFDKTTGTITGYSGTEQGILVVPATIDGVTVKKVAMQAFDAMKQKNIVFQGIIFQEGLEEIGTAAFYGTAANLKEVYLPESVTKIADKMMGHYPFPNTVIIKGKEGSYAQEWAEANGFIFSTDEPVTASINFSESSITIPMGEPTKIQVQTSGDDVEVEWSISNRQLNSTDTTEYLSFETEPGNGTSCTVIGNSVMPLTPYNNSRVVGTITAAIKGTQMKASIDVIVEFTGKATGVDILKSDGTSVEGKELNILVDEGISVTGVSLPLGSYEDITYSSSDTSVATVNASGSIQGKKAGTAQITATSKSGASGSCTVTVKELSTYETYVKYYDTVDGNIIIKECDSKITGDLVIPETIDKKPVVEIANYAFAGCSGLKSITLPSTITKIGDGTFNKTLYSAGVYLDLTLIGDTGSYVESYAKGKNINFESTGFTVTQIPTPSVTMVPSVTEAPSITASPSATETPSVTASPSATGTPSVTASPSATETPSVTASPSATEAPSVTASPSATETPSVTASPSATETPSVTASPSATETPSVTASPSVTETPSITASPSVTEAPSVTASPSVTEEPSVTASPSATDKPVVTTEPTKEPEVTKAVTPTQAVQPTQTPTKIPTKTVTPTKKPTKTVTPKPSVKKGQKVKDTAGNTYTVKSVKTKTVEFTKGVTKKTSISIPATIKVGKDTYKVSSIAKNACKGNTKVTSITIGKNVTSIGSKAFYGCKNLKKVTIKTTKLTKKSVGSSAFKNTKKTMTVKVPKAKLAEYKKWLKTKGVSKTAKITK